MARPAVKVTSTDRKKGARPTVTYATGARKTSGRSTPPVPFDALDFRKAYNSSSLDRIRVIKAGISAKRVSELARAMDVSQDVMMKRLGFSKSTVSRKVQAGDILSIDQGELVLGMSKLIGLVQTIVDESGDPDQARDFDAAKWLEEWLSQPNPALGNVSPSTYLDTREGQEVVSTLIAQMQSGAYA